MPRNAYSRHALLRVMHMANLMLQKAATAKLSVWSRVTAFTIPMAPVDAHPNKRFHFLKIVKMPANGTLIVKLPAVFIRHPAVLCRQALRK